MKEVKNISLPQKYYPEAIKIINELAVLEDRTPHNVAKRLILKYGKTRIQELTSKQDMLKSG